MKRALYLLFTLFLMNGLLCAQQNPAAEDSRKPDTIVVHEYNKHGKLTKTTTWVGTNFRFTEDYYDAGSTRPSKHDTLDAIQQDTISVTKFNDDGRPKWDRIETPDDYIMFRDYYYSDTIWGYTETDRTMKKNTYELREFYPDSTPRIIGTIVGRSRDGHYLTYYKDGRPQCICNYEMGNRDSAQKIYYANGNLKYEGTYAGGVENGVISEYYENGNPESVYKMVNGTVQDTASEYHENGQLWTRVVYRDGKVMEVIEEFDEKGNSRAVGTLKKGNGTMFNYSDDGTLYSTDYFKDGKKVKTVKAKS